MKTKPMSRFDGTLLDRIVLIGCRLTKGQVGLICTPSERNTAVLGSSMHMARLIKANSRLDAVARLPQRINHISNLQTIPWFKQSIFAFALPPARTALMIPLHDDGANPIASFTILEPGIRWPCAPLLSVLLLEISELAGNIITRPRPIGVSPHPVEIPARGFSEADDVGSSRAASFDTVSQFLFKTLVSRQVLRSRNAVSYIAVRTWRSAIRKYQIDALAELKQRPPDAFVHEAAAEMVAAISKIYGTSHFDHVVPIPCGHSNRDDCLSVLLAKSVATMLGVKFTEAFERQDRPGKSHPRKNAKLPPLKRKNTVTGNILLVDDVATSGRHLEQASAELASTTQHVFPIVWIGN